MDSMKFLSIEHTCYLWYGFCRESMKICQYTLIESFLTIIAVIDNAAN